MNYLLDTNILLHAVRRSPLYQHCEKEFRFDSSGTSISISIVSAGEIYSLAYQLKWGFEKLETLEKILSRIKLIPIPIDQPQIIKAYAEIDAYSQGALDLPPFPKVTSARNMGKNDLWIAATAYVHRLPLLTTDKDFDHLDGIFIKVIRLPAVF